LRVRSNSIKWLILSLALFSILVNVVVLKDVRSGDAFISMYFGLNLYDGRYLEFNTDEPSSGASSPLWMYLHAIMRFLSVDFSDLYTHFIMMKGLNVLILILSSIVLWRIMDESKTSPIIQIVVLLFWALNPFVINWTTRCLELPLQALTCWYGIYRIFLRTDKRGKWSSFVDGVVFGLIVLTRYESGLLLCFLTIYALISKRWENVYDFILLACGFLLAYGYHLGFMLSVFGTILPSTAVKGGRLSLSGIEPIKHLLVFYGPFVIMFLINLFKFSEMSQLKKVVTLWIIVHLGFVTLILGYSHLQRYFLVVIPLIVWISLESPFLSFIPKYAEKIPTAKAVTATSIVILLLAGGLLIYGKSENSLLNRFILFQREDLKTRTAIAEYIKNHIPPDSNVAMKEVDWIPLYSRCKTLDIVGILYGDLKAHKGSIVNLLKDKKPPYMVVEENFVRCASGENESLSFKRKLVDLLAKGVESPYIDGMRFERIYSVPYSGSGGQLDLFKGNNTNYTEEERSKWRWYLLKINYS